MSARYATAGDVPAVAKLFRELHGKSVYKDIEVCNVTSQQVLRRAVSDARLYLGVYERGGKITAALLGMSEEYWWSRAKYATDLAFYSGRPGDGIRVAKHFVTWAKQRGVVEVVFGISSGLSIDRTAELYNSIGFDRSGSLHMRMLK